jgi:hypothetical protein
LEFAEENAMQDSEITNLGQISKKAYFAPEVRRQEHLRDITMGNTPNLTEGRSNVPRHNPRQKDPWEDDEPGNKGGNSGGVFENDVFGG